MKEDKPYLQHILDSIRKLEKETAGLDETNFILNELVREYSVRKIEVIGEAAKHLSPGLKEKHKAIPWSEVSGMRDKLIHHYMGVDYRVVWEVIHNDLPKLKQACQSELGQ